MSAPFNQAQPAGFRIITADERMAEQRGIKGVLTGISGIGKTSQLWTLDAGRTLFVNLEAGELAVQGWPGDEVRVRSWEMARDLACWIGGPNPAMRPDQPYDTTHYERVCTAFGSLEQLAATMSLLPTLLTRGGRAEQAHAEHRAILKAIGKRDGEAAEAAARKHARAAQKHRLAWMVGTIGVPLAAPGAAGAD